MAPAKTGRDSKSKKAVKRTDQTNKGMSSKHRPETRILTIVTIKLMAPRMDETPAICRDTMARSTLAPGCPSVERGG